MLSSGNVSHSGVTFLQAWLNSTVKLKKYMLGKLCIDFFYLPKLCQLATLTEW